MADKEVSEKDDARERAFQGLADLAESFKNRGGSITHEEIKAWINQGRS